MHPSSYRLRFDEMDAVRYSGRALRKRQVAVWRRCASESCLPLSVSRPTLRLLFRLEE
jgi:hypothetical protein